MACVVKVKKLRNRFMGENFLKQFDAFFPAVSKEEIASGETRKQVDIFNQFIEAKHLSGELKNLQGRLGLSFEGYDSDQREVYEIEEIREWVKKFIKDFPLFFYFFNIKFIQLLTFCALDAKRVKVEGKTGYAFVEPDKLVDFVGHYLLEAKQLFEKAGFKQEEINKKLLKTYKKLLDNN